MIINRRAFLRKAAGSFGVATMGGMAPTLLPLAAHAADTSGYRALVCVFLYGGLDCHDTIIPYDLNSYTRWAEIRSPLVQSPGEYRARSSLLSLNPLNSADFGSRQFALPQEMSGLHGLFQSGQAAIAGNVGPLIEPVTLAQFEQETVQLPSRLFSHNDQQANWMSSSPEGAQFGWAGFFGDAVQSSGANTGSTFTSITTGGADLLITGQDTSPYQIDSGGVQPIFLIDETDEEFGRALLEQHFRAENFNTSNLLGQDIASKIQSSYDANALFNSALEGAGNLATDFPNTNLGRQLGAVARTISIRGQLGVNRQIFVVGQGGFDTHSGQAVSLPARLRQIDEAVVAFNSAINELGVANDVTLFTASDFGRTLAVNGDGTDHGWGGHHFMVGGAVSGQRIYGDMPISDFGHELDSGGGRLIPTTSVEQFAAPLGRWFGLDSSELAGALPNLSNFSTELGFL